MCLSRFNIKVWFNTGYTVLCVYQGLVHKCCLIQVLLCIVCLSRFNIQVSFNTGYTVLCVYQGLIQVLFNTGYTLYCGLSRFNIKVLFKEQNIMQNNMQNVSDSVSDPVPGHSGYSVPSMEGVFCHSVLPAEEDLQNNLSHSVPSTEIKSLLNCAGIQQMSNPGKLSISSKVGSNNHSLAYLPLT